MPSTQHDFVIVGSGHNSLIAATYLAACGASVLVLERHSFPGGGAVSREITLPGFIHDTHATGVVLLQGSPILSHDELGLKAKYGLQLANPSTNEMTAFADGDTIVWHRGLDQACQEIAKYSQRDAESYRKTVQFVQSVMPIVGMSMARPPVSFASFLGLLEKTPFGNELITAMMKSSYEVITERFEHPKVRLGLLKRSMVSCCNPEERGTGLNILFVMAAIHAFPLSIVVGGSQNLTQAVIRCFEAYGGELRLNSDVIRIINKSGEARTVELISGETITARKAVIATVHPHFLGDMVEGLDSGLVQRARNTAPSYFGTLMVHAALKEKPQWKMGSVADGCTVVNLVDPIEVDEFRRMCDAPRWGVVSQIFSAGVMINTNLDPSRAPAGRHILASYNFVSFNLKEAGPEGWDNIKEQYGDWVLDRISRYAPNLKNNTVLARTVHSPLDLARYSPSFTAGDVNGLGPYMHQMLGMRPIPELAQYRVPGAKHLYLVGPFMHPGGGIAGGGRAVALRVMEDFGIKYDTVIRS